MRLPGPCLFVGTAKRQRVVRENAFSGPREDEGCSDK